MNARTAKLVSFIDKKEKFFALAGNGTFGNACHCTTDKNDLRLDFYSKLLGEDANDYYRLKESLFFKTPDRM